MSEIKNEFVHLNVHTVYSLHDSVCKIRPLVKRARQLGMKALAITDSGNMFGAMEFYEVCRKTTCEFSGLPPIKPIIGCEVFVAAGAFGGRRSAEAHALRLLAKNKRGYRNLVKIVSESHLNAAAGAPKTDRVALEKYREGLICLAGNVSREQAEVYRDLFGEDFFIEIQYHPILRRGAEIGKGKKAELESQAKREMMYAKWMIGLAERLGVKAVLTNGVRFLGKEDAEALDVWRLIDAGKTEAWEGYLPCSGSEGFKTADEMAELFLDHPELLANTVEIADRVDDYSLAAESSRLVFGTSAEEDRETLRKAAFAGAEKRWGTPLRPEVKERLDYELDVIDKAQCSGYVLVVADYVRAVREMGVLCGLGRGAVAGSAVLYSLGVTSVDPLKYDLLFERFLDPNRMRMADVSLDDEKFGKVVEYLVDKYGADRIAHIPTFGIMSPEPAIQGVSSALGYSPEKARKLAELVPPVLRPTFERVLSNSAELKKIYENGCAEEKRILHIAEKLDGCIRSPGVHACWTVLGPKPLTEMLPVMKSPCEDGMLCTQYDAHYVESVGPVQCGILGLPILSVFKKCLEKVRVRRGIDIDLDAIPDNDKETFAAFCRGATEGVFQFESDEMRTWLGKVRPDCLSDLASLYALNMISARLGTRDWLLAFAAGKLGQRDGVGIHPLLERGLSETYGVMIYQEQLMALGRILAGFTWGEADELRRAITKRSFDKVEQFREKFVAGCLANPEFRVGEFADEDRARACALKIFEDWYKNVIFLFMKAHAVCWARLAYQSMYLKTHYPAEFGFAMKNTL